MNLNLNNVLEYKTRRWDFTLVDSKSTDGTFILHYLMSEILRDSENPNTTILITFAQVLGHYKGVQSKLGNSNLLNEALKNKHFMNVDLMEPLSHSAEILDLDFGSVFDQAFEKVKQKADTIANSDRPKLNIIIDDISIPGLLGVDERITFGFVRKLSLLNNLASMIVYVQRFDIWLVNDLVYLADLVVQTENLTTGYSKEIDGQVCKVPIFLFF